MSAGLPFEEMKALLQKVPLQLPAITPVTQTQGVIEGIHLNIEDSDLHLSITEMESIIAGLDIEEKIKTGRFRYARNYPQRGIKDTRHRT